jgi:hypothetical protein
MAPLHWLIERWVDVILAVADAAYAAGATVTVGLLTLMGVIYTGCQSRQARRQLQPNGGGSAYDRILRRFDALEARHDVNDAKVDRLLHDLTTEQVDRRYQEAEIHARLDRIEHHEEH